MANENVQMSDVLARLVSDVTEIQSKLDTLILSNAIILSKLNDTEYDVERKKLLDKVSELKKLYSEALISDLSGKSSPQSA